jgi:hypothetical protein
VFYFHAILTQRPDKLFTLRRFSSSIKALEDNQFSACHCVGWWMASCVVEATWGVRRRGGGEKANCIGLAGSSFSTTVNL